MLDRIKQEPKDSKEEQYPQYRKLEEQIKQLTLYQHSFMQKINLICFFQFGGKLMSYQQSQKIMNIIQIHKKVINFSQIYLGTRDGLSAQAFWNKVNGKSNLLMVFKSKMGYIFGEFSPLSSFLFSQTYDQIYPLIEDKNKYAIYCNYQCGPCFGGNYNRDLNIDGTFKGCTSNLGDSYRHNQYQNVRHNTQLFNQATADIVECEIYQVTFA
ncbi:unnamed protein product [Paramecium sonneborni]|uniref:TLDc domain-containing protein n=1 Tax=Paramecium sonneborni TaxID=65129 RepID=A0A8S1RM70_9CILI|nr:unnamed protein product [Paramecium sonneborni]